MLAPFLIPARQPCSDRVPHRFVPAGAPGAAWFVEHHDAEFFARRLLHIIGRAKPAEGIADAPARIAPKTFAKFHEAILAPSLPGARENGPRELLRGPSISARPSALMRRSGGERAVRRFNARSSAWHQ